MKNGYQRNDFAEVIKNGKREFYIRVNKTWVKVNREIFRVCKGSYKKILKDNCRDNDVIQHYENIDTVYPYMLKKEQFNIIEYFYMKDLYKQLHSAILLLSENERKIIYWVYFEEKTEQEVASLLHITQPTLNYRKKQILKKLKKFL